MRHAVTPTDTGAVPAAGDVPATPARAVLDATAHAELNRLAFSIADEAARSDIELNCYYAPHASGIVWYHTTRLAPGVDPARIETALNYLRLRGFLFAHPADTARVTFLGAPA